MAAVADKLCPVEQQRTSNGVGGVTGKGFVPGKSGNPGGRAKGKTLLTVVRDQLRKCGGKDLEAVALAFVRQMKAGSFAHLNAYIEREEGKVPQRLDVKGGVDLRHQIAAMIADDQGIEAAMILSRRMAALKRDGSPSVPSAN